MNCNNCGTSNNALSKCQLNAVWMCQDCIKILETELCKNLKANGDFNLKLITYELLSEAETLWLHRFKKYLSDYKYDYVCSWWLQLEYRYEDITTPKINYILSKLVAKGILKKETTHSYTKFSLND